MDIGEVSRLMSMKPAEITSWVDVVDGVLVTTFEGAQTLLRPDGSVEPVSPRREVLNLSGRGSVKRHEELHAADSAPDLTPKPEPIRVEASVGRAVKKTAPKKA